MLQRIARTFLLLCAAASIGAAAQTYTRLASLADGNGENPIILVQGVDGNFYGVTQTSVLNSSVIFKMTPPGTLSEVYTFGSFAGAYTLIAAKDGNLYGLSYGDGSPYQSPPGRELKDGSLISNHFHTRAKGNGSIQWVGARLRRVESGERPASVDTEVRQSGGGARDRRRLQQFGASSGQVMPCFETFFSVA
jgi:hypothetical protein